MKRISTETRKKIADALVAEKIAWSGRLNEADFLSRLFDLKKMWSVDTRFTSAYGDITQHRTNFKDWADDWVFTDSRFNLLHADEEVFLQFLCEVVHPAVRPEQNDLTESGKETENIVELFNYHLCQDGYELVAKKQPFGKPLFVAREKAAFGNSAARKQMAIVNHLSSEYVRQQVQLMEKGVELSPYDAIGKAKELVETICKSILKEKGIAADPAWDLLKLVKVTHKTIALVPSALPGYAQAESSVGLLLRSMAGAIQGVAELRNQFGSGHGHEADFMGLERRHAKLCVGFATEMASFYLDTVKAG